MPSFMPCIEVTLILRVLSPKVRENEALYAGAVCDRTKGRCSALILVISNAVKSSGAGM